VPVETVPLQYIAFIVESEWDPAAVSDEQWTATMLQHRAFADAVRAAGAQLLGGDALQPASSAVRITPGASCRPAVFTDGPFGEVKEIVTGYYKIAATDAAQARQLAALIPTTGHVDLFPVMDTGSMDSGSMDTGAM
jgi:hypothetical protein